jgi:glycosyltransferase involved in cell wall biosynthesis
MAALEALAAGVPVVCSDGAAQGLPDGGAITYPTGDVEALGRSIRLLLDPRARASAIRRARDARASVMTADDYADRLLSIYSEALRH